MAGTLDCAECQEGLLCPVMGTRQSCLDELQFHVAFVSYWHTVWCMVLEQES